MRHYPVLIVGAGPTGLMAANQLARFGINFLIIDGKPGPTEQSRAIAVTARSLEIYQQMGISDEAIAQGRYISEFAIYVKGKQKAFAPIGELGKGLTDFSYLLAFEQSKNEALLSRHLESFGGKVSWNVQLESIKKTDSGFEAEIKNIKENSSAEKIICDYVLGCDGAKSPVRHAMDFHFGGGTYDQLFYVADTVLKWNEGSNKLVLCPTRDLFCGFFPMGGSNSHRIIGTIPKEIQDPAKVTFDDLKDAIKKATKFPMEIEKLNWFSVYKLHHRSVDTFSKGNCFLCGDAAHIHSPAGGQGMNTGLMDAYNLCWKLALVIKGNADKRILETYNAERLPFAKWLLNFTDRFFAIMTGRNTLMSWFRNNIVPPFLRFMLKRKGLRKVMFKTLSQTAWTYKNSPISKNISSQKLKFKAGDRLPYILTGSSHQSVYKLLTAPTFHLLSIGFDKPFMPENNLITVISLPLEEWRSCGVNEPLYILCRPDNYIGLIADELDDLILNKYLQDQCAFLK